MRSLTLSLSMVLMASGLAAQGGVVSPPCAVNLPSNSSSGITFTNATTRTQQADANPIGRPLPLIRSIAFRRTTVHTLAGSVARTADVTIAVGYAVTPFTSTFAANFSGTPTTVFTKKKVNLPDWTQTISSPQPFDLIFKFDSPFVYDRQRRLIWDLISENCTGGGTYYMDWWSTIPARTKGETPIVHGKGCTTNNSTFEHGSNFGATSTNLELGLTGKGAPSNAAVAGILGATNLDLTVPGLCTKLHPDLLYVGVLGTSDATGLVSGNLLVVPWVAALAGLDLVTQLLALDASQAGLPFALSNGLTSRTPYAPGGQAFQIDRTYSTTSTGPTGITPTQTAVSVLYQ